MYLQHSLKGNLPSMSSIISNEAWDNSRYKGMNGLRLNSDEEYNQRLERSNISLPYGKKQKLDISESSYFCLPSKSSGCDIKTQYREYFNPTNRKISTVPTFVAYVVGWFTY